MVLVGKTPGPSRSTRTIGVVATIAVLGAVAAFGAGKLMIAGSQTRAPAPVSVLDREREIVENRARNRLAQRSARAALVAATVYYTDYGSYETMVASTLHEIEPSLGYTTGASTGAKVVSFRHTWAGVMLAVYNGDDRCFAIGTRPDGRTGYRSHAVDSANGCRAHAFTPSGLRARW